MRKKGNVGISYLHTECPFCGYQNSNPPTSTPWCGNRECAVEYYRSRCGQVWYDTERKTKDPLVKSIWASGGLKIGE